MVTLAGLDARDRAGQESSWSRSRCRAAHRRAHAPDGAAKTCSATRRRTVGESFMLATARCRAAGAPGSTPDASQVRRCGGDGRGGRSRCGAWCCGTARLLQTQIGHLAGAALPSRTSSGRVLSTRLAALNPRFLRALRRSLRRPASCTDHAGDRGDAPGRLLRPPQIRFRFVGASLGQSAAWVLPAVPSVVGQFRHSAADFAAAAGASAEVTDAIALAVSETVTKGSCTPTMARKARSA